jgi:hypothetical protein
MEAAAGSTTPIDLRHVNQCRLFYKSNDYPTSATVQAGTELLPQALSQSYPQHNIESNQTWPRQGAPAPRAWASLKRTLRCLFLADRAGRLQSFVLSLSLAPWEIDTSSADTSWQSYYDPSTDSAYERFLDDYWPVIRVRPCRRIQFVFSDDYPDNTPLLLLPPTATPAALTTHTIRRPNLTPHQPRPLSQLLGQKRKLRPRHAMPRAPSRRSLHLPN